MVADYAFWRDLEAEFAALHESADRLVAMWSGSRLSVNYDGPRDERQSRYIRTLFDTLAARGGIADGTAVVSQTAVLTDVEYRDHWLSLLRAESPHFYPISVDDAKDTNPGWIQGLRTASREYCKVRATRAMAAGVNRATLPSPQNHGVTISIPPSFREIEQLANEIFNAGRAARETTYRETEAAALSRARATHNSGAFVPALVQSRQERLRSEVLALADAWVEAGATYSVPLPTSADNSLENVVLQMAAAMNSAIEGELGLRAKRTRTQKPQGFWRREMHGAMSSAQGEAKLKLKKQRIESSRAAGAQIPVAARPAAPSPIAPITRNAEPEARVKNAEQRTKDKGPMPRPFPNRAAWLKAELADRDWNKHHLHRFGGPEHRTAQKILDGLSVQEDVLRKVIDGLQAKLTHKGQKLAAVEVSDIPND